jgi:hypothetical protein
VSAFRERGWGCECSAGLQADCATMDRHHLNHRETPIVTAVLLIIAMSFRAVVHNLQRTLEKQRLGGFTCCTVSRTRQR